MESKVIINVSRNGKHFFQANQKGSNYLSGSVRDVIAEIKDRFPESEGYKVSVTLWECVGKLI